MDASYRLVLKSGQLAGQTFMLEKDEVVIGRDGTCDIVINDPEVSRRHSRIFHQGANFIIEDLGSTNGTSVNGQRLVGAYILRPGEIVTLGEHTNLLFEATVFDPDATMVAMRPPEVPPVPEPSVPAYSPVPPASGFSGQIPGQPARPKTRKGLSTWVIILIVVVVILACGCIAFAIFDALNLYCEFPDIMNLLIPGACPP